MDFLEPPRAVLSENDRGNGLPGPTAGPVHVLSPLTLFAGGLIMSVTFVYGVLLTSQIEHQTLRSLGRLELIVAMCIACRFLWSYRARPAAVAFGRGEPPELPEPPPEPEPQSRD